MPAAPVDATVLVPVLNERAHLADGLRGMLGQRFDGRLEVLLIDGGSTDGSRDIMETWAARDDRVRVLDNPARHTPAALNIGLARARGTYVVRMDAHTRYPPAYIALGVERLRRGGVVSVSGPQLPEGTCRWSRRVALALSTPLGVGGARFRRMPDAEIEVDSGFTGVWRRDTLVAAGGWDDAWHNDQDLELAARLRADGGRIVCLPGMAASYIPRSGLRALGRQYWRYGYFRVKTSRRHPQSLRRSQVLPPALVLAAPLAVRGPRLLVAPARGALAAYGVALAAAAAGAARRAPLRDAASVPGVLAVMHAAYGAGFLGSCARGGPPWGALLGLAARRA